MISVSNLTYIYDKRKTDGISDITFDIPKESVVSLVGPSGSGKTTTLKCLAGIIKDYKGTIDIPSDETIAYVDQIPTFDLKESVFANLSKEIGDVQDEQKKENQIRMTLSQLDLTNEINTIVADLSGGQRQRLTIAKSLIKNPTTLLLDEPFANLDKSLRLQLFNDLFPILKDQGISLIWVTHNQEEALRFSDKLVLLNFGKVEQIGTPKDLYYKPQSLFAANFFGETNVSIGKIVNKKNDSFDFTFLAHTYSCTKPTHFQIEDTTDLLITIKPEFIDLREDPSSSSEVIQEYFLGSSKLLKVRSKAGSLWSKQPGNSVVGLGSMVKVIINSENFQFLQEV